MSNIDLDKYYIINPGYKFKDDIKRIIVTNNNTLYFNDHYYHINISDLSLGTTMMHPLVAYMFAFFNGEMNLRDTIMELSKVINKPFNDVLRTFSLYIHNSEVQPYAFPENIVMSLPINFIIEKQDLPTRDLLGNIDINKMLSDLDLNTFRNYVPSDIRLMITNKCITDCVYCFANRSHKVENMLSFERIKELIAEAHSLGCKSFSISGGEFFLYERWDELLDILHRYEYNPQLSTKMPIGEDIIIKLKEKNIDKIQFSFDTVDREALRNMIKVPFSYLDKMKNTFDLLQQHNMKFTVKSVITKFNDDLTSIKNLIDFLLPYKNLIILTIAPGEHSMYKDFISYKSSRENLLKIQEYINELDHPKIYMQAPTIPFDGDFEEKKKEYDCRPACSGNLTTLFILLDGQVTMCEQMYWTPFFIMGDVTNHSIMEVWNSPKSLSFWNIKQDQIQNASPCKKCDVFENCRRGLGTCWLMAMQAYGKENYDFPAPNCPYAPPVTRPYYH